MRISVILPSITLHLGLMTVILWGMLENNAVAIQCKMIKTQSHCLSGLFYMKILLSSTKSSWKYLSEIMRSAWPPSEQPVSEASGVFWRWFSLMVSLTWILIIWICLEVFSRKCLVRIQAMGRIYQNFLWPMINWSFHHDALADDRAYGCIKIVYRWWYKIRFWIQKIKKYDFKWFKKTWSKPCNDNRLFSSDSEKQ